MTAARSLLLDLYELTMAECYFRYRRRAFATFELFVRRMPSCRSYLVACGLQEALAYVKALRFEKGDIGYLRGLKLFSEEFLAYLSGFSFKGDIWAMKEGTVCFANEPLLRVTAPLIQAQILESFLLNAINLQTMIASKASRVVTAASGRQVFDFSLRRTHGSDAAIKAGRASYIAGFSGTSNVLSGKSYGVPVAGTMAHSFVMSFENEAQSFRAYCETFPGKSILLVDTYTTKKGIRNAVAAGLTLKKKGHALAGIRLDSGDVVALSRFARGALDEAGLPYVKIFASGNLDEYKIQKILSRNAPVDSFGVGTNMGVSADAPFMDVIYKICEVTGPQGGFLPTMKLSKGKATYPGRKQVFRMKDGKGKFLKDVLALEDEKIKGEPLLVKVIERGKAVYEPPPLSGVRAYAKDNLSRFPRVLLELRSRYAYPVLVSAGLKKLKASLARQLKT